MGRARHPESFRWGHFNFTYTERAGSNPTWQAHCPYHARGQRTRCTKSVVVPAAFTIEDKELLIRKLKFWCVQAPLHESRQGHLGGRGFSFSAAEVQSSAALEGMLAPLQAPDV